MVRGRIPVIGLGVATLLLDSRALHEEARAMTTIHDLKAWKAEGRRFTMLTAYDFPTAQILDRAGIPVLLVGDSVGNNVLGYPDTLPVTMEEMLHHTRAVARGAERAMVVGDLPFLSYQVSLEEGVRNAGRLVKEGGAQAVKLEGPQVDLVHRLVEIGIPVMAHVGLTPQSVHGLGGYKVQGRGEAAHRVAEQARQLEKAGAFSIVLEAMPSDLAAEITGALEIPTIGIGAGPHCDAQVLVINDLLGINERVPKLAKKYADLRSVIAEAAESFAREVDEGRFPDADHSYD
jgi:3-methyl-2-oxobutanoate hydroxymethyltransferase